MNVDQALGLSIHALKEGAAAHYGYDFYASTAAQFASNLATTDHREREELRRRYYPFFEEAGWVLSLRGILRPGVREVLGQAAETGGYTLTAAGLERLADLNDADVLLYQSSALLDTFSGYEDRFGFGFAQRSAEAIKCRDASAWLASCVMSGAAAEAVLLSIAVAKNGTEEEVLNTYKRANGRRAILNMIIGDAARHRREQLTAFTGIISVWRDEAGHGAATQISTANADEALRQLLHMCQWAVREWDALTQ